MSTYRVGEIALMFEPGGAYWLDLGAAAPAPPAAVTPALSVGYLDASGARQWTSIADGVTTISGIAPFAVTFYGGDSVSTATDADSALKAFNALGYLFNFGEALGGNWAGTGRPVDTERGGPVAGHVYTTAGTFQARLTCRDSAGNQAFVRVNVVVSAPGAGVDMTSGVIPAFASNTVYNAPAGGTWGNIAGQLDGLQNVIIRKTGAGADPVFGTVTLDSRNEPNSAITRTRGVRFVGCDVARIEYGNVGFDYCAFVGGRVRALAMPDMGYAGDQIFAGGRTALQASNVRMARGLFLHNTGVLNDSGAGYVIIGGLRELHLRGITLEKTSAAQHNTRGLFAYSSFRNCVFNNTVTGSVSYLKLQGWDCTVGVSLPTLKGTPDPWPADDTVVNYAAGRRLGLPLSCVCVADCVMGLAGSDQPDANLGFGPENNNTEPAQGCERASLDHCTTVWADQWYTADLTGRYLAVRDYRLSNGAGALMNVAAGVNHPNRTPDGWAGPYYAAGSRPVVVP